MNAQTYVDLRLWIGCIGGAIGVLGFVALLIWDHRKR